MNLNFRKTALLAGICSVFSLGYAPQLFAVSSTDTVEAVQQTKKITGVVSDARPYYRCQCIGKRYNEWCNYRH